MPLGANHAKPSPAGCPSLFYARWCMLSPWIRFIYSVVNAKMTHTGREQREWHRMASMTGQDCAVTKVQFNNYTHTHKYNMYEQQTLPVSPRFAPRFCYPGSKICNCIVAQVLLFCTYVLSRVWRKIWTRLDLLSIPPCQGEKSQNV